MNKTLTISVIISLFIVLAPQSRHVYSALTAPVLNIPEEYQEELIANQKDIDKYKKLSIDAYEKNKALLDELLVLNGIVVKDGEMWSLSLIKGKWQLYKK